MVNGSYISNSVLFVVVALFVSGCSTLSTEVTRIKDAIIVHFRKPGESMILPPAMVWEKARCSNHDVPLISIDQYQVIPVVIPPGSSFSQRLIYSLCTNKRGDEILGTLYTRIYFRGKPIVTDRDANYAMKPGKWRLDRIIDIPADATPGVYAIEMEFRSSKLEFQEQRNLVVENRYNSQKLES